ncbi:MAG: class II aldolase/adducin family protein [Vallitaleaceae bacterium]|jgi:L-fuculose-phosphate aldolase|nr:class II aldolase/adducin family protein [Vallitaleaceae bacterium]
MNFDILHPADQIIMIMQRIYGNGMTTTSGGNLSIIDENGDIWITPGGVDKGSLTRKDIIRVTKEGTVIGEHKPSIEFPFHKSVYDIRPDLKAVLHAHPPALVAMSSVRKIPNLYIPPNVAPVCGKVGMAKYGLPGSDELGKKIADVFAEGMNTVMLENHGVVVGAINLFEAFKAFETLDFSARLELKANIISRPKSLTPEQIDICKVKQQVQLEEFEVDFYSTKEKEIRREMSGLIHRAYNQQLFTSTQGTFSQRIDEKSFVITPYGVDRKYIEAEDLVRIENGEKEKGKKPSRSVLLHQKIYEQQPHVNSIIIAHAPNIMAFATTDVDFDSRTIPESYLLLRDMPKLPFGDTFLETERVAGEFTKDVPVILMKNDCIIATGSKLIEAFDRLEVAEYSAKAIIASKSIGEIVSIEESHIEDIKIAFNL